MSGGRSVRPQRAEIPLTIRNFGLALVSIALSVLFADQLFRVYERHALVQTIRVDGDRVDLAVSNYNDSVVDVRRAEGEFRVLSFGDSFAYAIVQYPYSYHAVAAANLERDLGHTVRIVNLGEPATSFEQYRHAIAFWSGVLESDALVVNVYLGNDILDVARNYVPAERGLNEVFLNTPFSIRDGRPRMTGVPERFPLRMLDWAFALWKQSGRPLRTPVEPRYNNAVILMGEDALVANQVIQLANFDPAILDKLRPGYASFARLVEDVSARRRKGIRTLIVLSPNETQVDPGLRERMAVKNGIDFSGYEFALASQTLRALARAVDPEVPVVDLTANLRCLQERGVSAHYRTDSHWSVEGNQLVGEVLAQQMRRLWFPGTSGAATGPCVADNREGASPPLPADLAERVQRFSESVLADDRLSND
jgi:hypothetical protein